MTGGAHSRLMQIFLQELQEGSARIERDLLALETAAGSDCELLLQNLMRAVHSLKGAAGAVKLKPIELVCHKMEDLLSAAVSGRAVLSQPALQALIDANDVIRDGGGAVGNGQPPQGEAFDRTISRLSALIEVTSPHAVSRTPAEEPVEAPSVAAATLRSAKSRMHDSAGFARILAPRLDALLNCSGELTIARSRARLQVERIGDIQELIRSAAAASGRSAPRGEAETRQGEALQRIGHALLSLGVDLGRDMRAIEQAADALDYEVRRTRLEPFSSACEGLERLARDLAPASGKDVALEISGGELEVDRTLVQQLHDLLRHLVRNAIDHGVEPRDERLAAGKPERACIAISAALSGEKIVLTVADDGRGLDSEKIREQAQRLGVTEDLDPFSAIFRSGLSTAPTVTTTSGRGVGLSIVKAGVEGMRGAIVVESRVGAGTLFRITLPTGLGTISAVLVRAGEQIYAIDTSSVDRLEKVPAERIRSADGRRIMLTPSGPIPALKLSDWLEIAPPGESDPSHFSAVLLNEIGSGAAILVDSVIGEQKVLVRSLGERLQNLTDFVSGSILPDGTIALILNAARLGQQALSRSRRTVDQGSHGSQARRILVADDSLTTRTLGKTILESAGYTVFAAADGTEAWQILEDQGADLVLADVDMPGMSGIRLTETIRRSPLFSHLPVILLTARESEADKLNGLNAGADAYLLKSAFDQRELLRTIDELI